MMGAVGKYLMEAACTALRLSGVRELGEPGDGPTHFDLTFAEGLCSVRRAQIAFARRALLEAA